MSFILEFNEANNQVTKCNTSIYGDVVLPEKYDQKIIKSIGSLACLLGSLSSL